jgi:hypothetical protein
MKPRVFLEWSFAVACAALFLITVASVGHDVYRAEFPRLEAFLKIRDGRLEAVFLTGVAAALATVIVYLLGWGKKALNIEAGTTKITGLAGPVFFWTVSFVLLIGAMNYSINAGLIERWLAR